MDQNVCSRVKCLTLSCALVLPSRRSVGWPVANHFLFYLGQHTYLEYAFSQRILYFPILVLQSRCVLGCTDFERSLPASDAHHFTVAYVASLSCHLGIGQTVISSIDVD